MSTEQADRNARNVLELVLARRQIAAVRAACELARAQYAAMGTRPHVEVSEIEYALDHGPLTRGDVGGVWYPSRTTQHDPGVGALTPTSPRGLTTHHLDITERGRLLKW